MLDNNYNNVELIDVIEQSIESIYRALGTVLYFESYEEKEDFENNIESAVETKVIYLLKDHEFNHNIGDDKILLEYINELSSQILKYVESSLVYIVDSESFLDAKLLLEEYIEQKAIWHFEREYQDLLCAG